MSAIGEQIYTVAHRIDRREEAMMRTGANDFLAMIKHRMACEAAKILMQDADVRVRWSEWWGNEKHPDRRFMPNDRLAVFHQIELTLRY